MWSNCLLERTSGKTKHMFRLVACSRTVGSVNTSCVLLDPMGAASIVHIVADWELTACGPWEERPSQQRRCRWLQRPKRSDHATKLLKLIADRTELFSMVAKFELVSKSTSCYAACHHLLQMIMEASEQASQET